MQKTMILSAIVIVLFGCKQKQETTQKEVFLQEISDRLTTLHDSTNQVLTAIKMKINYLQREQLESRNVNS